MKQISEKLTQYIIKSGAVSPESYAVYQYGFQVGLEMLCSLTICCITAILLDMILEFVIFTAIFMLLRTYAGGIHLERFSSCLICSVGVQTLVLFLYSSINLPFSISWTLIVLCSIVIVKMSPVECENRELNCNEKKSFKMITKKIVFGVVLFSIICTLFRRDRIVFLVALILLVVMISQYIGKRKYGFKNDK